MDEFYIGQIRRGLLTIEQVPFRWRDEVSAKLSSDEAPGRPEAEEHAVETTRSWLSGWQRKK